ncbi:hypothetical protein EMPS_00123 [Entomortierella parvispora]|uniref:Crinkler effector protein N-terminal domain-containing protein n=1 Tax=Entomortierella parvispora TaxID=205924 RepID=A0A9P3LRK4_9FUNG|nr:hypothetical protein EMPS_00123 [Entomortierella parvispora]
MTDSTMADSTDSLIPNSEISLCCVVDGRSTTFSADILPTKTVDHLKQLICTPARFPGIAPEQLTLWKVSIPLLPKKDRREILLDKVPSKEELDESDKISRVFSVQPPEKTIHIIVQLPSQVHAPPFSEDLRPDSPLSGDLRIDIKKITERFFARETEVVRFLTRFVQGHESLPRTTGSFAGLPRVWLRNQQARDDKHPSLLFLDLPDPSTSREPSKELTSDAILDLIKRCPGNVPIFGVSGCGKTRGLIELLSRHWGFYFNASGEDLGSDDMSTLLAQVGSRLGTNRGANNRSARTMTYLLFLSRLLILQFCLRVDGSQSFTSARWTLLQACPHMFMDVFEKLFQRLLPLYQRSVEDEPALMDIVRQALQNTRAYLIMHGGAPQFLVDTRLFVVLDEAQILGEDHVGHFESLSGTKVDRPLLSPILSGFGNIESVSDLTILTSGTGLSIYILNWARSSGMKHVPGAFDYMEFMGWTNRESVDTYIASVRNQLLTEDARLALDDLLPPEARDLLLKTLVGRFRPIVTAIETIISNGTPGFWKQAIEYTEARLVSWEQRREHGNLIHEIIRLEDKYRKNLDVFQELCTVEEVLGLLLFQRYMFGADSLVLQDAIPELVERAFGRIKIVDGAARTVLDEPFAMKAAENYVRARDAGFIKTMDQWMQRSNNASVHGFAWELMMMNVFIETFKTRALSDWPHNPSISSQCSALDGNATIVGLDEQGLQCGISHEHIQMKEFMSAHVNNGSMHNGRAVPPFFFPKAKPSGPDVVFLH